MDNARGGKALRFLLRHKLALLLVVCAAARVGLAFTAEGINSDGPKFAMATRRMADEGLLEGMKGDHMWPYYPINTRLVTYPYLASLLCRVTGDTELSLRLISALSSTALVAFVYLLAREVLRKGSADSQAESADSRAESAAFLAAAMTGLEAEFIRASASVYREPTAALIAVAAVYLFVRVLKSERRWPAWALGTGVVLFVGFLTRVDFLLLAGLLCAAAVVRPSAPVRRRLAVPAIILLTLAVLEVPYYLHLTRATGRPTFSQWQVHRRHPERTGVNRFLELQGEEP